VQIAANVASRRVAMISGCTAKIGPIGPQWMWPSLLSALPARD
jgi:hypothetical protein